MSWLARWDAATASRLGASPRGNETWVYFRYTASPLLLHFVEDFSIEEICAITGTPASLHSFTVAASKIGLTT